MSGSSGDVAALDRIATRVALTKEEELEALMGKLICPVILKLGTDDNEVKAKVTQLISVINQRVKAAPELKLPTKNLLQVYKEHHESPLIANVALMQLVVAIQRVSTTELRELVGLLSAGISQTHGKQQRDLLHLTFFAMTAFEGGLRELSTQEKIRESLPFLSSPADRQILLDFALKLMLHPPVRQQEPTNPLQAGRLPPSLARTGLGPLTAQAPGLAGASVGALATPVPMTPALQGARGGQLGALAAAGGMPPPGGLGAASQGDAAMDDAGEDDDDVFDAIASLGAESHGVGPVAPGLSSTDMETLTKPPPGLTVDAAGLDKRRVGFLKLINAAEGFEPQEVALVALAGSCCPDEQVSRAADVVLQKRCTLDGIKPSIDLEAEALLRHFFELIAGSASDTPAPQKRPPASPALRMRLLRLCCKSVRAANLMPQTLEVIVSGLERTRVASIKLAACEFVVWVLKHADDGAMAAMAKPAFERVIGSLSMMDPSDSGPAMQLRGFLYQAVGELAQRAPDVFHSNVEIAGSFFQALAAEPDGIRATVQEAINRLAAAYKNVPDGSEVSRALRAMLEAQSRSQVEGVRACALNWAIEVFPFDDAYARMLCMRLASDPRPGIRAAAQKGLKMAVDSAPGRGGASAKAAATPHPTFSQMLTAVRGQFKALRVTPARSTLSAPVETLTAALRFLEACHRREAASATAPAAAAAAGADADMADTGEAEGVPKRPRAEGDGDEGDGDDAMDVDGEGDAGAPEFAGARGPRDAGGTSAVGGKLAYGGPEHLVLLEHALVREAPTELQLIALTQLLAVAHVDPAAPAAHVSTRLPWLRAFLSHVNADVRLAAARLLGSITAALPPSTTQQLLSDLVQRLPGDPGGTADSATAGTAASSKSADTGKSTVAVKFAETHGSLLAAGLVAAGAHMRARAGGEAAACEAPAAAKAVAAELCNGDVQVALAAGRALGFMALAGVDVLPAGDVKAPDLSAPAKSAAGGTPPATMADVLTKLALLLKDPRLGSDSKARVPVVRTLGHLAAGASAPPLRAAYATVLLAQAPPSAAEEFHFAVGESLCLALSGASAPVAKALLFSPSPTLAELRRKRELAGGLPGGPADADSAPVVTAGSEELKETILDGAIKKASSGTADERAAAAVWLVLLLALCGGDGKVAGGLPRLQAALVALLAGDTSDLVQDMASHGLSAAYSAGNDETKELLVNALVEKLQMAGPALQAARTDAASKDGAAKPAAPSTGQGSLATYKELCTLATSLGQPRLLYALIDVAAEATPSAARRGAALGLHAESTDASRAALQPHVPALLPLLYRASYDPNTRVSDAMTHLLTTIVPQRAPALTQHFAAVMKELLASLGARSWRARQAACLAAADLLPGRRWPALQPHFGALWDAALRVADDLKDSVRVNGERLLRSLSNLTCRLADTQQTAAADASAALALSLPLLIDKGLQCRSASVRDAAVGTLASIVAVAAPHEIAAQLAPLIAALLEALSTLEANAFNVLDMHADRLGVDRNTLEEKRVQAASKTPIHGALDTCARLVDEKSAGNVAAALARLVRQGVGLNTRTGAARFVVALTMRLPPATLQKPAGELLKALLPAACAERSAVTQRAFASAIGALAKCASGKRLEWLLGEASTMFSNAEDDDARKAGGLILQQICRYAAQRLDAAATAALLPRALRARYDPDATVAAAAADIMTELGASAAAVLRASGAAAATPVIADLDAAAPRARRVAAAAAAAGFATDGGAALAPATAASLAAALVAALPGRVWAGKEAVPSALAAVAAAVPAAFTASPLPRLDPPVPDATAPDDGAVVGALVAAAVKPGGREMSEAAAESLVKVLEAFKGRDHLARLNPVLQALESQLQRDKRVAEEGAMDEDDTPAALPMQPCLAVAAAALKHHSAAAAVDAASTLAFTARLAPLCTSCLSSVRPWKLRLQAAQACEAMLAAFAAAAGAAGAAASEAPGVGVLRGALLGGTADEPGALRACIGLKAEKVSQVRAACISCVQAAAPLLDSSSDADLIAALKALLVDMGAVDKDPAIKTAAAKLLKQPPFSTADAAPMEH